MTMIMIIPLSILYTLSLFYYIIYTVI